MQRKKEEERNKKERLKKKHFGKAYTLALISFPGLLFQLSTLGGRHQLKHSLTAGKP